MVALEGILVSIAFALLGTIPGYIIGILKPIAKEDYYEDRKWCQKTKEIYEDIEKQLDDIDLSDRDDIRGDESIEKAAKELKEHTNDYPNYRREERNQAKKIADNVLDAFPSSHATGVYGLGKDSSDLKKDRKEARESEAEEFRENREKVLGEIEHAREELSFGLLPFGKSIICGQRKI